MELQQDWVTSKLVEGFSVKWSSYIICTHTRTERGRQRAFEVCGKFSWGELGQNKGTLFPGHSDAQWYFLPAHTSGPPRVPVQLLLQTCPPLPRFCNRQRRLRGCFVKGLWRHAVLCKDFKEKLLRKSGEGKRPLLQFQEMRQKGESWFQAPGLHSWLVLRNIFISCIYLLRGFAVL